MKNLSSQYVTDLIKKAQEAYELGVPIMSDEQYDALWDLADVSQQDIGPAGDYPHPVRMYSLKKYYETDEIPKLPDPVITPKLDGAAVSITYVEGVLVQALTRGNGEFGKDITEKLAALVPNRLPGTNSLTILGEVVAPKELPNSRNFVAGALNLKNPVEFEDRVPKLNFVAYDSSVRSSYYTYLGLLEFLEGLGFTTVRDRNLGQYPQDGVVIRANSWSYFEEQGYTDKYPRAAFAVKKRKEVYTTTLLDVEWNTGKTGFVAPTAILEPVKTVDGAVIRRATLNNYKFITDLDLEIGCKVTIERAGDIIPRILNRVYDEQLEAD